MRHLDEEDVLSNTNAPSYLGNERPLYSQASTLKAYGKLTQTLNLTFLYDTVSTLKPTVGIVVTDCPSLSLYKIAEFSLRIKSC